MDRYQTYINFAIRSGVIIYGLDNILQSNKKNFLIIIDKTFNEKNRAKLDTLQKEKKCDVVVQNEDTLVDVVNKVGVKVIAITNKELAKAILLSEKVHK